MLLNIKYWGEFNMVYNVQLDDAIETVEDWLNSSKASLVLDTIQRMKSTNSREALALALD